MKQNKNRVKVYLVEKELVYRVLWKGDDWCFVKIMHSMIKTGKTCSSIVFHSLIANNGMFSNKMNAIDCSRKH